MASSLTMSLASLSVSGAGRATVARMGVAARAPAAAKGAVGGSAFFASPKSASKMTMSSSLAGVAMPRAVAARKPTSGRGDLLVVAGGNSLGCTLHGTRRARARTSGYRARLQTPGGRKVLKSRRAKGRKYLAPAGAVNGWNREKKKSLK